MGTIPLHVLPLAGANHSCPLAARPLPGGCPSTCCMPPLVAAHRAWPPWVILQLSLVLCGTHWGAAVRPEPPKKQCLGSPPAQGMALVCSVPAPTRGWWVPPDTSGDLGEPLTAGTGRPSPSAVFSPFPFEKTQAYPGL